MRAFTLCFTGISGSGKTTLARRIEEYLKGKRYSCQVIDGDELRNDLGNLFGYTREERMKNSRIVQVLAKYLNNNNVNVVVAIVAPYEEMRQQIRKFIGDGYIEVFVDCQYKECAKRDVKGYYQKQKKGEMKHLNGADDVYEVPEHYEIVVDTANESIDDSAKKIITYLEKNQYVV